MLWVPKRSVNVEALKRALTFEISGRGAKVTILQLWQETPDHLLVPREFWRYNEKLFEVVDCRPRIFQRVNITSHIRLDHKLDGGQLVPTGRSVQREALDAMLQARGGILQLSCGSGKTLIALELIARLGVPAIVVMDNTTLIGQWRDEIQRHLPGTDVGLVEGSHFDWQKPIVLATFQTLSQRAYVLPEEFRRWFGVAIWDEGHHVGAPTFARTADMFYGRRYALTATPRRADGMHVVYDMHIGPVLYKDLTQDLRPRIQFEWTGFELDTNDPVVVNATHSSAGEIHLGMLARWFGSYRPRLEYIVNRVRQLRADGRKILVLSTSIDELVNLMAVWNGAQTLYSDIPLPTPQELDPSGDPRDWEWKSRVTRPNWSVTSDEDKLYRRLIKKPALTTNESSKLRVIQYLKDVEREMQKRQKQYLQQLLRDSEQSDAGLMIYDVKRDDRRRAIHEKPVTFSIMKYGREGLDSKALDTVVILEPQGQKEWIQQVMGRALRLYSGKKEPLIIFLEDAVGIVIGLCNKLRYHLRNWPVEEGGPYQFEMTGNRPRRIWR
jgi:superfamily II DNA or RNA helicase